MKNVLLIKGSSQYNAMRYYIDEIELGFRLSGYNTIKLDTHDMSFSFQLDELANSLEIDYIFTCNAITIDACNKFKNATYVTYLCDHPAIHKDRLKSLDEKAIVFTCDRLHEEYIRKYCTNIKYVKFIPLSGSYSKKYIPYPERKYGVVFTGSYCKPEKNYLDVVSRFDGNLRTFAEYMLKDIVENPKQTLDECLSNALKKAEMQVSDEEFHELMHEFYEIDAYARNYYRDKVIRLLIENGIKIHVFGNGWNEFQASHLENLVIEEGNSYIAQKAVANAKISLNLMPWFKAGFQERIATAMLSGTVAVTDESEYINANFKNEEELVVFSLTQLDTLPQKVKSLLEEDEKAQSIANAGKERAELDMTWQHRTFEIVDFIELCTDTKKNVNNAGQLGEILRISYQRKNSRIMADDIIIGVNNILELLSDIKKHENIDVCDVKYLYTEFLYLFIKAKDNFSEVDISDDIHEYLMNLKENNLCKGIELLVYECANFQSMFLRTEYGLLKKEIEDCKKQLQQSKSSNVHEQEVLVKRILQKYQNVHDDEIREILEMIKGRKCVTAYNQRFILQYTKTVGECLENVYFDENVSMHYVFYNGKRMYYPKSHTKEYIASQINFVHLEQDMHSPHRYLDETFDVAEGAIVIDAGVAEGNFSLDIVERVKKLYLIECEHEWVEALQKTFEPWKEKVVIIEKMLGGVDDDTHIKIDSFVEEESVNFIKMDVEGAEVDSLKGASRVLRDSKNIKCAICAYHRKNAEKDIREILEKNGFFTTTTAGYMFFKEDIDSWVDAELRRGIVRATK